jgi:hypothetical protein
LPLPGEACQDKCGIVAPAPRNNNACKNEVLPMNMIIGAEAAFVLLPLNPLLLAHFNEYLATLYYFTRILSLLLLTFG